MPERLLATILIANNLVNVTIVVLMSFALSDLFAQMPGWLDFLLQTVLLTFLILLFGEIIPKLVANTSPIGWARFASSGLGFFVNLFYPVSSVLVRSTKLVNRVVTKQSRNITADELGQALEITSVEGRQDKAMLCDARVQGFILLVFGGQLYPWVVGGGLDVRQFQCSRFHGSAPFF